MSSKDFKLMVQDIRNAEKALGKKDMNPSDLQVKGIKFARSLYVVKNVKKGETFSDKNVKSIRPGFGLHPKYLVDIIGKKSKLNLEKGTRFSLDFIK